VDKLTPERRSDNMRQIRSKDTSPEMTVRRITHGMGYRYRLHAKHLPGKPDLIFPARKKIIFIHGCFWHGHGGCREGHVPKSRLDYWKPKLERNRLRDAANEQRLRDMGWTMLTLWECELRDTGSLQCRLQEFLA
jgi:DNA mismatch endonuclease (patch repair protein)